MDRIIEVKVGGNYLFKDNKNAGVRGEANVVKLRITFDESWDNYAKKITFWDALGYNPVEITLTTNLLENIVENTRVYLVSIPAEPLAESGMLTFVIDGYSDGKRQRSLSDRLEVKDAPIADNAGEPADPTPSQAEQLQAQVDGIMNSIQSAVDAGQSAVNAEQIAKNSADSALECLEDAEEQARIAKEYADNAGASANRAENAVGKTSYIGENGNWFAWDIEQSAFYDTGVKAQSGSTVYYGENPPEEADVWIDPNGEGDVFAPYKGCIPDKVKGYIPLSETYDAKTNKTTMVLTSVAGLEAGQYIAKYIVDEPYNHWQQRKIESIDTATNTIILNSAFNYGNVSGALNENSALEDGILVYGDCTKGTVDVAYSENMALLKAYVVGDYNTCGFGANVEGNNNQGLGISSHTEGDRNTNTGLFAHVEGSKNIVSGSVAHCEGSSNKVSNEHVHCEGVLNEVHGKYAHGEGYGNTVAADSAHCEGRGNKLSGYAGHVEGYGNEVSGAYAHGEGALNVVSGDYAHAENYTNIVSGYAAHGEGHENNVSGKYAHGEGRANNVSGYAGHGEGRGNKVSNEYGHGEGYGNQVFAKYAHGEGYENIISESANASHCEGRGNKLSGGYAHCEGYGNEVSGEYAHGEGSHNMVSGMYAHGEGRYNIVSSDYQHVEGKFNAPDSENKYAHIVGGGTSNDARRNIHTIDWNGNAEFAGDIIIGSEKKFVATAMDTVRMIDSVLKVLKAKGVLDDTDLDEYERIVASLKILN